MFSIPANSAFSYSRLYIALLAGTDNFLELEFEIALKILSSSKLNVSSELEVAVIQI